jgi:putative transposase
MRVVDPKTGRSFFQKTRRRFDEAGQARELTFSCYRGYKFLSRDRTRIWFLEELESAPRRWSFDLWAYVLMPEHAHLFIYPREPNLKAGTIAGRIKEAVARRAIAYLETNAPGWLPRITVREGRRVRRRFWQPGGGYDRNLVDRATAHRMVEYIHANPVRRGLVESAEQWEWSSARSYAGILPVRIKIDMTLPSVAETVPRPRPLSLRACQPTEIAVAVFDGLQGAEPDLNDVEVSRHVKGCRGAEQRRQRSKTFQTQRRFAFGLSLPNRQVLDQDQQSFQLGRQRAIVRSKSLHPSQFAARAQR